MSRHNLASRVHNGADMIYSRDVIKRIRDLESTLEDQHNTAVAATDVQDGDDPDDVPSTDFEEWLKEQHDAGDSDAEELIALRKLQDEAEGSADWQHGETLIRDSYFEQYAEELADDIGAINSKAGWPLTCIDWKEAADQLKQDYMSVDFDGVTYWIRS